MGATVRTQHDDSLPAVEAGRGTESGARVPGSRIAERVRNGVVVLRPSGGFDRPLANQLRKAVLDASSPVIVDLDECVLIDTRSVREVAFDPALSGVLDLCIVCRRLSCRKLLARSGVADRFAVFERVEDALQAFTHAREGYGPGWSS